MVPAGICPALDGKGGGSATYAFRRLGKTAQAMLTVSVVVSLTPLAMQHAL